MIIRRLVFLQPAGVGLHKQTRTFTMVNVMTHRLLQTVRQRASAIPNVVESTGMQRLQWINAAGWVDLGLVGETTAVRVASLTTAWREAVLVNQRWSYFNWNSFSICRYNMFM